MPRNLYKLPLRPTIQSLSANPQITRGWIIPSNDVAAMSQSRDMSATSRISAGCAATEAIRVATADVVVQRVRWTVKIAPE